MIRNLLQKGKWTGLLIITLIFVQCLSLTQVSDGGGSHTGNGSEIYGIAVDQTGEPLSKGTVEIYSSNHNPILSESDKIFSTSTNDKGEYSILKLPLGSYNIIFSNPENTTIALLSNIEIDSNKKTQLPEVQLLPSSVIQLKVPDSLVTGTGYVYALGTPIYVPIESSTVLVHGVPKGLFPPIYFYDSQSTIDLELLPSYTLTQDTLFAEAFSLWNYSQKITINTSASGAGIDEDIFNFPLLLRLNPGNFDFTQSNDDGSDIRFTSSEGKLYPHQIEQWSAAEEYAIVWINVEKIEKQNDSQVIHFYWGNPQAENLSNGTATFDTAHGFGAVWHLSESSADTGTASVYLNSVENENHGNDFITGPLTQNLIGKGPQFYWGDNIRIPNTTSRLKPTTQFTISLWVQSDTADKMGSHLASMGDDYGMRINAPGNGDARFFIYDDPANRSPVVSNTSIIDNLWHHCTGVYDGQEMRIYVDGILLGRNITPPSSVTYNLGPDFRIGLHGTGLPNYQFRGFIDEVRLSTVSRSDAWIKMSYETQKPDTKVLSFSQ